MVDIISKYTDYFNATYPLPPMIKNSSEMQITGKYNELDKHLGNLRGETMKYTFIDPKSGGVKTKDDPRLTDLQQQIQSEDARLQKLRALVGRIGTTLEQQGVESIHDLRERRGKHTNTLVTAPWRAWDKLRLCRELPPGRGGYPDLLPSDLVQLEEFKAVEDAERAHIDEAKAALAIIDAALKEIDVAVNEGMSL